MAEKTTVVNSSEATQLVNNNKTKQPDGNQERTGLFLHAATQTTTSQSLRAAGLVGSRTGKTLKRRRIDIYEYIYTRARMHAYMYVQ